MSHDSFNSPPEHATDDEPIHGGNLDFYVERFAHAPKPWIDISTGIAPWSYPFSQSLWALDQHLPTDGDFRSCETAMAEHFGVDPRHVLAVPGTEIVIRLLPLLMSGTLQQAPLTYGDYATSWLLSQRPDEVGNRKQYVRVICNPNNPTGEVTRTDELLMAQSEAAANNSFLVIDEAYIDAGAIDSGATAHPFPFQGHDNVLILKSFGKFFGLPGIRLGAVIGHETRLKKLSDLLGNWRVSTSALHIGALSYRDTLWQNTQKQRLSTAMADQMDLLRHLSLDIIGGTNLFVCIRHTNAAQLWQHLMSNGIYTRLFKAHGLLRFGLISHSNELARLKNALQTWR